MLLVGLCACQFDTSNTTSPENPDGDPTTPDAIDPKDCPDDIRIAVSVNGITATPAAGQPYLKTLIGDTVTLSAAGSCTKTGVMNYEWLVEPSTSPTIRTALPDLQSPSISVYAIQPEAHTVRLTVGDGSGKTKEHFFFAFQAVGFQPLGFVPGADVRDLSAGPNYLWIAGKSGAYRADLDSPESGTYPLVNDLYNGDAIPTDSKATHEEAAGEFVWFGANSNTGQAYRVSLTDEDIRTFDLAQTAKSRDIYDATSGVRFATDKGVYLATDSENFQQERSDPAEAVFQGSTGAWAGKAKLYPLPNSSAIDLFTGNNKINSITDDGTMLWVGGDNQGIATLSGNTITTIYTASNSNLSSNKPRAMVTEASGDIWVATDNGVSRFKQDRKRWIPMTAKAGLSNLVQKAIAIDESDGRRALYSGGPLGLNLMSATP